jgi:large-conductance mechanosensitive channel
LENIEQELQTEAQPEIQVPEEVQLPEQEKMNWGRFVLDIIETLVLAVVLFLGINTVSARVRVDGFSMIPTLRMASLFW